MNKEGKKCVIYVRVSTEMQVDGFSLDGQRNTLKRYAEREGMIVKNVYEDAGKSGKNIDGRPAFKKMIKDIEDGLEIDYILVYKLSRFGRNADDILSSIEYIQSYDVNLIASEEGIDSSQTSGRLLISVLSAVAEIERENILEQTMNGRKEKARQGGWNGGFAPYGYKLDNGKLVIVEEEAEIIRKIFDMYVNDDLGYSTIAKILNEQNIKKIKCQNGTLDMWAKSFICGILDNPIYKGTIAFGRRTREKVKGTRNEYKTIKSSNYIETHNAVEGIITEDLWNKAAAKRIASREKQPTAYNGIHLLSGILRCPKCDGPLYVVYQGQMYKDGEPYKVYEYGCANRRHYLGRMCDYEGRVYTHIIDNYVVSEIKKIIANDTLANMLVGRIGSKTDTSKLDKELNNYKAKLKLLHESKRGLENDIDNLPLEAKHRERKLEDMKIRLDDLYDEIFAVEKRIEDVTLKIEGVKSKDITVEKILDCLHQFNELFDSMTLEEKRRLIELLISKITFTDDGKIDKIYFKFPLPRKDDNLLKIQKLKQTQTIDLIYQCEAPKEVSLVLHETINRYYANKGIVKQRIRNQHYNVKHATYKQINEYIKEKYGYMVHSSYIAEVKRNNGVAMISVRSKEDTKRVHHPTPKKVAAIEDALRHFNIIQT